MKTVAQNIISDRWRQKKRRGILLNFEEVTLEGAAGVDDQTLIPQRLQIENALEKLNQSQRDVLDLRIIKGYSAAETAKILGKYF